MNFRNTILLLLVLFLAACAQPEPQSQQDFSLSEDSVPWTLAAMSQPGTIEMQISPSFESYTVLQFLESSQIDGRKFPVAVLAFSGEHCRDGYELVLSHKTEESGTLYTRSDVLPWNRPVDLVISWDSPSGLTLSAGDFETTVELTDMPDELVLATSKGSAEVGYIHFKSSK
ncbi:hypothetical protein [Gilvimarinus sp. DA14]|uniref:hypothetical protein n=1 Tax=Gilvimarinus sp. DA14 TaxID=2956798 RepID=UPI0020B6B8D1|nr:hypothetical protein [Gilvimarinus sp. DA14]UTF58842.1 hypothetical protein NHM04_10150 [Gilvimarinus sp. DA14]